MKHKVNLPDLPDHFNLDRIEENYAPALGDMYIYLPEWRWVENTTECQDDLRFVAVHRNSPPINKDHLPSGWKAVYKGTGWDNDGKKCYYMCATLQLTDQGWATVEPNDTRLEQYPCGSDDFHYWELIPPREHREKELQENGLPKGFTTPPEREGFTWIPRGRNWKSPEGESVSFMTTTEGKEWKYTPTPRAYGFSTYYVEYVKKEIKTPEINTDILPKGWKMEYRGRGWKTTNNVLHVAIHINTTECGRGKIKEVDITTPSVAHGYKTVHYWELIPTEEPTPMKITNTLITIELELDTLKALLSVLGQTDSCDHNSTKAEQDLEDFYDKTTEIYPDN